MDLARLDFEALDREHGLPEGTVRSVAWTESRMDPKAVSPAGAQGLMQLMPATGRSLGLQDPFDAVENAKAGAKYLGQLYRHFGNDLALTLAAYNAGPGRVAKGGVLPAETRAYVPKVQGSMAAQEAIFGGGGAPAGRGSDQAATAIFDSDGAAAAIFGSQQQQQPSAQPQTGRDPDVPLGIGEPGSPVTRRDPDVPDAPPARHAGMDEDVPMPGAPSEYVVPFAGSQEDVPIGMRVIPPSARPIIGPFVRGLTDPVGSQYQDLSWAIPDEAERYLFGGRTLAEIEQAGEERYREGRDPSSFDLGRLGGQLAASTLALGTLPIGRGALKAAATNFGRGGVGATIVPTQGDPAGHVQNRNAQMAAGGAAGLAGGLATSVARRVPIVGPLIGRTIGHANSRLAQGRGVVAGNVFAGSTGADQGQPVPTTPPDPAADIFGDQDPAKAIFGD